jgi:hypothetical protein
VQAEEEEGPGLMMACVEEVHKPTPSALVTVPYAVTMAPDTVARAGGNVFLNEERAIISLGRETDMGGKVWPLDTGGTNHMIGSLDVFVNLDQSVAGKVRFADGFVVDRGTVIFTVLHFDVQKQHRRELV